MPHICDGLLSSATNTPKKVVTVCGTVETTAESLAQAVAALAAGLVALGVKPGHRVALLSHNTGHLLQALLATAALGAISVPLNWRWTAQDISAALKLTQPSAVFCEPALCGLLTPLPPACTILLQRVQQESAGVQCSGDLISAHQGAKLQLLHNADRLAMIVFTSGTTGMAKGVCLSHATLDFQARAKVQAVGYCSDDVYLHVTPLCHVGGLVSWLSMLYVGAQHILLPAFSAQAVAEAIQRHHVTSLIAVPAMVADLLAQQQHGQPLSTVKRVLLGAGELPLNLHAGLRELFPAAQVLTAYGMTECASSITYANLVPPSAGLQAGSLVGKPPQGIRVAIHRLDADENVRDRPAPAEASNIRDCKGETSAASASISPSHMYASEGWWQRAVGGEHGEIATCGQHVMTSYWRDPKATAAAFLPGRWLRTGDLGRLDADGNLWLVGRLKDVIRSGSENVAAGEVEQVLLQHPGVSAAAVVGLPHSRLGEQVAALIVLRDGYAWESSIAGGEGVLKVAQMVHFCRDQGLAGFKLPRVLHAQQSALPVNTNGKVLKHVVKEKLMHLEEAVYRSRM